MAFFPYKHPLSQRHILRVGWFHRRHFYIVNDSVILVKILMRIGVLILVSFIYKSIECFCETILLCNFYILCRVYRRVI